MVDGLDCWNIAVADAETMICTLRGSGGGATFLAASRLEEAIADCRAMGAGARPAAFRHAG